MKIKSIQCKEAVRPMHGPITATKNIIVGEGRVKAITFEAGFYAVETEAGVVRVPVSNVVQDVPLVEEAPKHAPKKQPVKVAEPPAA